MYKECAIAGNRWSSIPARISGRRWAARAAWRAIGDLYRRIEQDELLRVAFPHFHSELATPFFVQWFGGSRDYSDDLAGGLLRRHQHRYISPKAAAAWLRCMRETLVARGLDAEPIMRPLARIAKAMIHSPETEPNELCKSCDAVQDAAQVQFETLLNDAAKGRTENVRKALENDRTLANRRGMHNRTLAWVATYRNRPIILELTLKAGADCNTPACDPMHATMACDNVTMNRRCVTPGNREEMAAAAVVRAGGARPRTTCSRRMAGRFSRGAATSIAIRACYLSIPPTTSRSLAACHAVCGGSINAVKLLLERSAR
jgi:truncated hemoglobin YjbI